MRNPIATAAACLTLALAGAASAGGDGEQIYQTRCAACHASGAAGAPKLGDQGAWDPRLAAGKAAMLASVVSGKGAMPAKGACMDCSEADLEAALDYMLSQVQ